MGENQDISKIIGIIMENPDIIEKIKNLASSDDNADGYVHSSASVNDEKTSGAREQAIKTDTESVFSEKTQSKKRRNELLRALKPYVKSERARAIDTMLSVIDVIDVMKER